MTASRTPWPWPAETSLDRSRKIAQIWRSLAKRYVPTEECDALDAYLAGFGETWMVEQSAPDDNVWMSRDDVARLASVDPDTVSSWTARGHLKRHPEGYAPRQVRTFLDGRRPGRHRRTEGLDQ